MTSIANTNVITIPKVEVKIPEQVVINTPINTFNGNRVNLLFAPIENQPTTMVSLSQISSETNNSGTVSSGNTEVRVPVGDNSIMDIVNGGVNLPEGVNQLLFVVNEENKNNN